MIATAAEAPAAGLETTVATVYHGPMVDYKRLQALDGDAWSQVESEFFHRIFFYVRRFVSDFQRAEDLTQETFLASIKAIENYDPAYNMEQYLFGIAHNKVIDHLRRQGRSPVVFGGQEDDEDRADYFSQVAGSAGTPSTILVHDENFVRRRKVLVQALRGLVEEYWKKSEFQKLKAVELVFLKRLKHAKIADMLGISDEKAIAGIKFRAIRSLKTMIKDRDPNRSLFIQLWQEHSVNPRVIDDSLEFSQHPDREDKAFAMNVAEVWVSERVSCPHRDILRAFLARSMPDGQRDYVGFHLETIECPFCCANVEDLQLADRNDAAELQGQVAEARERSLASSQVFLTTLRDSVAE